MRNQGGRIRPAIAPSVAAEVDAAALEVEAELDGALVTGSWVDRTYRDVEVRRSRVAQVRLSGCAFDGALLEDVELVDCDLSGVTFERSTFHGVSFERCRMSGLVAPQLAAIDLRMVDCDLTDAWLRMAVVKHADVLGCGFGRADLYGSRLRQVRLLGCALDETEWSHATLDRVVLHGSSLDGLRGVESLGGAAIGSEQVLSLAMPLLAARGIVVDDDHPALD